MSVTHLIISALVLLHFRCVDNKDVILYAGIGNWSSTYITNQYMAYQAYSDIGLVNAASILAYYLTLDGMIGLYEDVNQTDRDGKGDMGKNFPPPTAESFQWALKKNLGLKAYPCVYCDATIGACTGLSSRLDKLFTNQSAFIKDTLARAKQYGWDGYSIDLEVDGDVNRTQLTDFIIDWGTILRQHQLRLFVWIGSSTQYDIDRLLSADVIEVITMDTYTNDYNLFINAASTLMTMTNISKIGLGLLTYGTTDPGDDVFQKMSHWISLTQIPTLGIWASFIPPTWYMGLHYFMTHFF